MADGEQSYIDYDTFLDSAFTPFSFANRLVTSTNNASDTPIDLSTPLSRVLFDQQEIDTHIHRLTSKSALTLLLYSQSQSDASQRILEELDQQVSSLTDGYKQLESEVVQRHAAAEEVRLAVSRLWVTVKIGRAVSRALLLGRQLDAQMADVGKAAAAQAVAGSAAKREDHRAMIRAAHSVLALRALFAASGPGEEGEYLSRINVVNTLRTDIISPSEQKLRSKAQQIVREFSLSSVAAAQPSDSGNRSSSPSPAPAPQTQTFAQAAETKMRTTSACVSLYLLSLPPSPPSNPSSTGPSLLLSALQSYLQAALTSSLASLARALASLSTLPRALTEVSARCQNISALENLLASIGTPAAADAQGFAASSEASQQLHGNKDDNDDDDAGDNLLAPLLLFLDTHSLPSYFWRSLASGLGARVQEILGRGGIAARNLRAQRDRIRESFREAVVKGCDGATIRGEDGKPVRASRRGGEWEREMIVVVGSVVGNLGR